MAEKMHRGGEEHVHSNATDGAESWCGGGGGGGGGGERLRIRDGWAPAGMDEQMEEGGYERPLDPNLEKLYRIYLTVPISSAQAKRILSRLKLIKSYLRSTMSESRLSNLALLFIERKISEKANFNNVVETFARMKNRKTQF
ncbi:52 kDa repressor of the inhibitor of the protein kinase-like [Scomber scombrus]|uniref:52 kDa repressor of the inhibitor of the protein kinase-like n=1 Tax=Scomber scombrus TaxID=13677 RepID=A0AAV1MTJ9_SCOSC